MSGHRENYFITGFTDDTQVKFQVSVKFNLLPNPTRHSAYFAFTQKSFWKLYNSSSPFTESNYTPEIFYGFYQHTGTWEGKPITPFLQNARVGLEHESNGVAGPDSRAWNRVYGYARAGMLFGHGFYATVAPKVWARSFGKGDNRDIHSFLGYGELTFEIGRDAGTAAPWARALVGVTLHGAVRKDAPVGVEVFAQWRPEYLKHCLRLTPHLFVQMFRGYGESLLAYNQNRDTSVRVGLSFDDRIFWGDR